MAAAVTAQMARGQGDALAHAEQYAAQTGQSLDAVLTRFGLGAPEIPDGWAVVWGWYWELCQGRGSNGFGPLPLSWESMAAWAGISGIALSPWLAAVLRSMDRAWLAAAAAKPPKR